MIVLYSIVFSLFNKTMINITATVERLREILDDESNIQLKEDIKKYLEFIKNKKESTSSIRRKISTFKSFYKYLYKNERND